MSFISHFSLHLLEVKEDISLGKIHLDSLFFGPCAVLPLIQDHQHITFLWSYKPEVQFCYVCLSQEPKQSHSTYSLVSYPNGVNHYNSHNSYIFSTLWAKNDLTIRVPPGCHQSGTNGGSLPCRSRPGAGAPFWIWTRHSDREPDSTPPHTPLFFSPQK